MKTYTIELADEQHYRQLLQLAEALGLGASGASVTLTKEERQHHLRIVAQGGSGKSIPDPVEWQRATRQDRTLPGRD